MARDAKLTFRWDNSVTGVKSLPNSSQTIGGALSASFTNSYSLFMNFGGFLNTLADAGVFAGQADQPAPGTPSVPLLHSGSRDQLYVRVAYTVSEAYTASTTLRFVVEGTPDATAASPVVYPVGTTIATGALIGPVYSSTVASTASNVMTVAAATAISATFSTTTPTITFAAQTNPIPVGSVVQVAGTAVPGGFAATTNYFVVSSTTTSMQLSATLGGTPIQATSGGTAPTVQNFSHAFAVGDIIQMTTVGSITLNGQTPLAGSVYQVLSVPTHNSFTIGLGPGSLYLGAGVAGTALTVAGTVTSTVFAKVAGGRIASVPIAPNFAGSLRLNVVGAGSGSGRIIINSASLAYGRDSAAIG
jgi:hypothetical protein